MQVPPAQSPLYREQGHAVALPRALGSGVSWAIIALTVASTTLFGVYLAAIFRPLLEPRMRPEMQDFRIVMVLAIAYMTSLVLHAVLAAVWTYRAWSWLPPELRYRQSGASYQPISPAKAAGFLLVPYFNLYWVFVIAGVMTTALERMRSAFPSSRPLVPHKLATIAPICTIVFTVFLQIPIVAAFPWILFMRSFEAVTRDFASERFPRIGT